MRRGAPCLLALALVLAGSSPARAAEPSADGWAAPDRTFRYALPVSKNPVRVALEEIGLLGAGYLQYLQTTSNSADWDLDYSWGTLGKKIAGSAIAFDTNRFDTNWVTHPVAGLLYYSAARANRLGIGEAFLVTFAASTAWEYFGEFREQVSINDMIVTPVGGLVIGEALVQLGAFFDRAPKTAGSQTFAWIFGAPAKVHDTLDGVSVMREREEQGTHDLRATVGVGATTQAGYHYFDTRVALSSRIVHAPGYERRGRTGRWLTDGNVSSLGIEATFSEGEPVDARFAAQIALASYLEQSLRGPSDRLMGHSTLTSIGLGFQYAFHQWDRRRQSAADRIASLDLVTIGLDQWLHFGPAKLHLVLGTAGSFASPTALAIDDYRAVHSPSGVASVALDQGYTYGIGGRFVPSLALHVGPVALHAEMSLFAARSIAGYDRTKVGDYVYFADHEVTYGGGAALRFGMLGLDLHVVHRERTSAVREVTREYGESSVGLDASLVY